MADGMFGAPTGINASDENIRRNITTGLLAQRTLGEIEQQPAEKRLKEAHADLYAAEASDKRVAAAQAQAMLDLQNRFVAAKAEREARGGAVEEGASQGRIVSVADVPPGGFAKPKSAASALEQFAEFAEASGVPPIPLAKVYKEIAEIKQKEAAAGHNNARQLNQEVMAKQKQLEVLAQVAASAASSPQGYMAVLGNPELKKMLPPGLTGDYRTDKPILDTVVRAGQDTIQRINADAKRAEDANQASLRDSEKSLNSAREALVKAREAEVKRSTAAKIKNGGENSPEAVAAKKALVEARKAVQEAKIRKEFPPAPLDPKLRELGKTYTAADGTTRFQWTRDPVSGKNVAVKIASPATATTKVKAAPVDNTEDDDGEDE